MDKQASGKKRAPKWMWIVLIVVLILGALGACIGKVYNEYASLLNTGDLGELPASYEPLVGEDEKDPLADVKEKDVYNILVAVLDVGVTGEEEERTYGDGLGMTDLLLFVRLDNKNNTMRVLQIPRDTYVGEDAAVPGGLDRRINGALLHGPNRDEPIANTAQAVYQLFGLKADNYVTLDVETFRTMVDTMGGVWMHIPRDLYNKDGTLLIEKGDALVSGVAAELILRNRNTALADYDRLDLQRSFYAAIFNTFMNDYPLSDALKVAKQVAYYMHTDLSVMDLAGIYMAVKDLSAEDVTFIRCAGGPIMVGSNAMYGVEKENMARILNEKFRPEGVVVTADQLKLPDVEFNLGYNVDEGASLGGVEIAGEDANGEAGE